MKGHGKEKAKDDGLGGNWRPLGLRRLYSIVELDAFWHISFLLDIIGYQSTLVLAVSQTLQTSLSRTQSSPFSHPSIHP